ncbi:MAG: oligosaccharide flippase family protein, partial [bacterium]|nr:oligosaccharide flippase family protein [bacterium]
MENPKKLTQRIFKGSAIVLFFAILSSPIGYLLRIFYSQTLSIENFGLLYAVLALFTTLATYNDLGFGYSTSYFIPKYFKKKYYQKCWLLYKYDQFIEVGTSVLIS